MGEQVDCLEITTMSACSVRCLLCPQDTLKAAYPKGAAHRLTLAGFTEALRNTPKHVRIHFSGFVEPWLNRECTTMLDMALAQCYRVAVYTTCVGMRDWMEVASLLIDARDRVDVVCVHHDDGVNMTDTQWQTIRGKFADALELGGVKLEEMRMGGPGFEAIDRAGLVQIGKAPTRHVGPIKCSYTDTYTHNVMLPNGDVVLCCMDYNLSERLGNLFEMRWDQLNREDIAHSNTAERVRRTICRKCHGAVPA